ncbi:MAG: chalcone isomerase family protein [Kofleriaceae bacterium]
MRFSTIFILLATALCGVATAANRAGVTMPNSLQVGDKQLVLNGLGLREATFLKIDVYVAGLYLEHVSSDPAKIIASDQTKRIVLHFVRDVGRDDIVKAWREGFEGNSAAATLPKIQPLIDRLDAWMQDFRKGQTLTFTYVPGEGVQVDVDATRKGVLKGTEFAQAMFAIWLGPKPPSSALKRDLLGKH